MHNFEFVNLADEIKLIINCHLKEEVQKDKMIGYNLAVNNELATGVVRLNND